MPRSSCSLIFFIAASILSACSSSLILPTNVHVSPTQDHLSPADIYAIQRLPPAVGIKGDVYVITAYSPDEVAVACGNPHAGSGVTTGFIARRKNGRWGVDRSTIETSKGMVREYTF